MSLQKLKTLAQSSAAHILAQYLQMFSFEKGLWTSVYYLVYIVCYFATKLYKDYTKWPKRRIYKHLDSVHTKIMWFHVKYLLIYSLIIQSACEIHPFYAIGAISHFSVVVWVIVRVCSVVLRRTVVGVDWRFDNLSGNNHQSKRL